MRKLISTDTFGPLGDATPNWLLKINELIQDLETTNTNKPVISYEKLMSQNEKEANIAVNKLRQVSEQNRRFNISEQANLNRSWTFERMDQEPGTEEYVYRAKNFINEFIQYNQNPYNYQAPNLIIIGRTGSGKSHLAGAITHELINIGLEPLFITMNYLIDNFFNNVKNKEQTNNQENLVSGSEFIDNVKTAKIVVLEDIITSNEPMKSFYADMLSTILRTRVNLNLSTIITCGHTFPEMHEFLGDHTFGSIQELNPIIIILPEINRRGTISNYNPEKRSETFIQAPKYVNKSANTSSTHFSGTHFSGTRFNN